MAKPKKLVLTMRCAVCSKVFEPLVHIARRAKVCTDSTHVCKKKVIERADGRRKVISCIDECCRSVYRSGASAQFMAGNLEKNKWFEDQTELLKVLQKVDKVPEPYRTAIFFTAETGSRIGEVMALRVSDLSLGGGVPHVMVPTFKRKGHPRRRVDLRPDFAKQLEKFVKLFKLDDDAVLFQSCKRQVQHWWNVSQRRAGATTIRGIHSLRHTHFSRLAALKVEPRVAQDRAGWSSLNMYSVYTHVSGQQRSDLVKMLPSPSKDS